MRRLSFTKMHGLGNDFLVVEGSVRPNARAAQRLCDRRRGVGADGILSILPPRVSEAAARMHVLNADGSVAAMCGNGLRCVVRRLLEVRGGHRIVIDTDAGLREGWCLEDGSIRVGMGVAALLRERVSADVTGARFMGTGVSMGNPHLVLDPFPAGGELRALAKVHGPVLEWHPDFPDRTNVEFFASAGPQAIELEVFERGSGLTAACGTGASAAAVVAARAGLVDGRRPIAVHLPGGTLEVELLPSEGAEGQLAAVAIRGEAVTVFRGEVELSEDEVEQEAGA